LAAVEFAVCHKLIYGHPNDEALNSHSLYGRGLSFYSVHRVINSTRLATLEKENAVHARYNPAEFLKNKEHYIFTFQDSTLECLVTAGDRFPPKVLTFQTTEEAWAAGWDAV
jgi:hypothetical protein